MKTLTKEIYYVISTNIHGKEYTKVINPKGKRLVYYTANIKIAQAICKTGDILKSVIIPSELRLNTNETDRFIYLARWYVPRGTFSLFHIMKQSAINYQWLTKNKAKSIHFSLGKLFIFCLIVPF